MKNKQDQQKRKLDARAAALKANLARRKAHARAVEETPGTGPAGDGGNKPVDGPE